MGYAVDRAILQAVTTCAALTSTLKWFSIMWLWETTMFYIRRWLWQTHDHTTHTHHPRNSILFKFQAASLYQSTMSHTKLALRSLPNERKNFKSIFPTDPENFNLKLNCWVNLETGLFCVCNKLLGHCNSDILPNGFNVRSNPLW